MTDEEKKEIKYRLSNIGANVGELALEYLAELEEENEQLQEKLNIRSCQNCKHNNKSCPSDGSCVHYNKWEEYKNPQLTKAKELIKEMLSILPKENIEGVYEITEEAEQFLRELEE